MSDLLTKREREILTTMRDKKNDEDGYIAQDGLCVYLGNERIAARTVNRLLRLCAISPDSFGKDRETRYYHINGTGEKLLVGDDSDVRLVYAAQKAESK
jgi:hypothetical protein